MKDKFPHHTVIQDGTTAEPEHDKKDDDYVDKQVILQQEGLTLHDKSAPATPPPPKP